jgi:hypothetical protein
VTLRDCGQYGVTDGNSCVRVMAGQLREGSYVRSSVIWDAMASGLRVEAGSRGLEVVGNVVAGSYDSHGMHFGSGGSTVSGNLVMGTTKVMEGKSSFDKHLPASFSVTATGANQSGPAVSSTCIVTGMSERPTPHFQNSMHYLSIRRKPWGIFSVTSLFENELTLVSCLHVANSEVLRILSV